MSGGGAFRRCSAAVLAAALIAGCGGSDGLTHADVRAMIAAKSRFLDYCGERKANGADENQPVPPLTKVHVDRLVEIIQDHRDETFVLDGEKRTVRDYALEVREILHNCAEHEVARIDDALD